MNKLPSRFLSLFALASTVSVQYTTAVPPGNRPDIVFILTDNQGAWSQGCFGNKDILTPNIDRLASEGIRFTLALSSNPVSSPTQYNIWEGGRSKAKRLTE